MRFPSRERAIAGGAVAVAMYDDHLEITNPGAFPFGITPEKLTEPHESRPWNPIIASVFYRAGIIERWGSGTLNIIDWCMGNGNPKPTWQEQAGSVYVTFQPAALRAAQRNAAGLTPEVAGEVRSLLSVCRGSMTRRELQNALALKAEENFRMLYLTPALDAGLVEMTIPDKPRSSKQKYRLTEKGRRFLAEHAGDPKSYL